MPGSRVNGGIALRDFAVFLSIPPGYSTVLGQYQNLRFFFETTNYDFSTSRTPPFTPRPSPITPLTSPRAPRHGRRPPQIPPSRPQILPPTSPPPQPRHLPLHPRIHHNNLAQSQRSPAPRRENHHHGQKEHQRQPTAGRASILRMISLSVFPLGPWNPNLLYIYIDIQIRGEFNQSGATAG